MDTFGVFFTIAPLRKVSKFRIEQIDLRPWICFSQRSEFQYRRIPASYGEWSWTNQESFWQEMCIYTSTNYRQHPHSRIRFTKPWYQCYRGCTISISSLMLVNTSPSLFKAPTPASPSSNQPTTFSASISDTNPTASCLHEKTCAAPPPRQSIPL